MELLMTLGLTRPARRRGFCPACRGWREDGAPAREIAPSAVAAVVLLAAAALAWVVTAVQARTMGASTMGSAGLPSFVSGWTLMTAAMMLPTAVPFVVEFAGRAEKRRGWPLAMGLGVATYLALWVAVGTVCFLFAGAVGLSSVHQRLVAGSALVLAGAYALTPLKQSCEARCRELCALHTLPFNVHRAAVEAGARYGLSCIGCSAGPMIAAWLIGMTNLAWTAVLAAIVLAYKLGPAPGAAQRVILASGLATLGAVYLLTAAA